MSNSFNVYSYYRSVEGVVTARPATASLRISNATASEVDEYVQNEDDEDIAFWIEDNNGKKIEDSEIW